MIRRKEPEKEICVVVARPGDAPISIVIENTLKNFQDLVTGRIETFPFWGYVGVCNAELRKEIRQPQGQNDELTRMCAPEATE